VTFLLLFPSGARRGKLQAIPFKNFSSDRAWSHIILAPDPVFLSRLALGLVSLVFFGGYLFLRLDGPKTWSLVRNCVLFVQEKLIWLSHSLWETQRRSLASPLLTPRVIGRLC